jgi:hypothetical protein
MKTKFCSENLEGRDHFGNLCVGGRVRTLDYLVLDMSAALDINICIINKMTLHGFQNWFQWIWNVS